MSMMTNTAGDCKWLWLQVNASGSKSDSGHYEKLGSEAALCRYFTELVLLKFSQNSQKKTLPESPFW